VARQNLKLFSELKEKSLIQDFDGMQASYQAYLDRRGSTYMVNETGKSHDFSLLDSKTIESSPDEGYAGVALNLIEALIGDKPVVQILNVANHGAITGMGDQDVVEIPTLVSHDQIQPVVVGDVPMHCLGLIHQVKHYEHLTIEAAIEKSYSKALLALTLHPLVRDFSTAKSILDEYITLHHSYFPTLQ
jgi:6-phospho-beta-glucosidase